VRCPSVLGQVGADADATSRATVHRAPDTLTLKATSSLCFANAIRPHFGLDPVGLAAAARVALMSSALNKHETANAGARRRSGGA
jgi:hypothetical protein